MNSYEIFALESILTQKKINPEATNIRDSSGNITKMFFKNYKEWLAEFRVYFLDYGRSIFDNITCAFDEIPNYAQYRFALYDNDNNHRDIEWIIWDFDNDRFTYHDTFGDIPIETYTFTEFLDELKKLHPGIQIPNITY